MEWQSPRKIEEDIKLYRRKRFEEYWQRCEIGMMTRIEMLAALEEEEDGRTPQLP